MRAGKAFMIWVVILSSALGYTGCKQSANQTEDYITIDVTATYPKKELILQDFLDVEYIPLETTEEFLTTGIVQAIANDFILLKENNRTWSGKISFFGRNGRGLRTFDRKGQGGEEYANVLSVALDEENNEIFVNSLLSKKILVYDLTGNFKRSLNHKENSFYNQIEVFDRDYLICHEGSFALDNLEERRDNFMLVSKQDGSIKEIPSPYKTKKLALMVKRMDQSNLIASIFNKQQIPYQGSWLLVEASADTIYWYTQNQTMKPFIARTPSVQLMEPEVFLYPGVLTDRYYFMQAVKKEYDFATDTGFPTTELMYDKQENAIFKYIVYNNDFIDKKPINLVYEIPIPPLIINNNEIAFITRLEAPDLVEAYQRGKLKGRLKEIASELNEESNPVIMIAKYKK